MASNSDIMEQLKTMAGVMATKQDVEELKSLVKQGGKSTPLQGDKARPTS